MACAQHITGDMTIEEVIRRYPDTISALEHYGLRCSGCCVSGFESIKEGALSHGVDLDSLLEDLNRVARD